MTSYNAVNGIPMTVHREILEGIVRRSWGFKGYITTDCDTLDYVVGRHTWRPEGWQGPWTRRAAVAYAVKAGVNANCGRSIAGCIRAAINDGLLREEDLDLVLVRLFIARMRSGEFDPDGGPFGAINGCIHSPAAQALAEKVADEAVVLLQNQGGFLPLKETLKGKEAPRLVLIGQRADKLTLGDYSTWQPQHTSTILEGVRAAFLRHFPKGRFTFVRGGESGEKGPAYLMNIRPPALLRADGSVARQLDWKEAIELRRCQVEATGNLGYIRTGSPAFVRFRELDFSEVAAFRFPVAGPGGQAAPTCIEIRQITPSGTLMATLTVAERTGGWQDYRMEQTELRGGGYNGKHANVCLVFKNATPRRVSLSPEEETAIREADAVVVFADTAPGEKGFYENTDGEDLALPRRQIALIQRAAALNPRTAVYLQTVTQSNVEPYRAAVKSILWPTYNGQAQGNAAGRLLMGDVGPSARLPFTWYTDVSQLADIRDYTLTPGAGGKGRTYRHFVGDVTYPFGHGLTYSRFAYANLTVSAPAATPDDTLTVTFDLTNAGAMPAAEVAQLYVVSPGVDGVRRPKKRLCAFQKVSLAPGETRRVAVKLPVQELWFWDDARNAQTYDQGAYTLQVGPDAQAAERLTASFALKGALTRKPHALVVLPSGHFLRLGQPGQRITVAPSVSYNDQTVRTDLPLRYASSAPDVAAVDPATGVVTPKAPGLATITASYIEGGVTVSDAFPVCVQKGE